MGKKIQIPWQIRLYKRSLMKKEKVSLIKKYINQRDKKILDLGCAQGVVSYFIKEQGGDFFHTDLDFKNLTSAKELLENNLFQIEENHPLPLKDQTFDIVFALDILEHVNNDGTLSEEIFRVLKPGGQAIFSTPIDGKFFILNKIKKWAGLKPEIYGHKRPGYSIKQLRFLLENHDFKIVKAKTYSKFFTEFFEIMLNILYIKKNKIKEANLHSGSITPTSQQDMKKDHFLFTIYSYFIYPFVYLITRIDKLLFFKTGYATFIIAKKNQ